VSLGPGTGPVDGPQAGIARRLAASVYEVLLLGALAVAITLILLPLLGTGAAKEGSLLAVPGPGARAISFLCLFAVLGAYCVRLWSGGRRTLPMRTWDLALLTTAGAVVSPKRAAVRYVAGWIGPACAIVAYLVLRPYGLRRWAAALLLVNYAWALVDRNRRFLSDRLAGTRLVHVAALSPAAVTDRAPGH
jgi:uncharacterized RDD family membrane protein YckC